jgi:hypothetical protein
MIWDPLTKSEGAFIATLLREVCVELEDIKPRLAERVREDSRLEPIAADLGRVEEKICAVRAKFTGR